MDNPEDIHEQLRIGIRAQDIQTSTQDIDLGPLNAEIKSIRLIGMAERLAIHIRGADVIDDYKKLEYISSQFGIDSLVLPRVLEVLQDLEWVRVHHKRNKITAIDESVPYFNDIYETAGEYFSDLNPTEIEIATISICDDLALAPSIAQDVISKMGLDDQACSMVVDIGRSGGFIGEYQSEHTGERVLYSPLYWVENPEIIEQVFELLKRFGADRIHKVLSSVRSYQGFPLPDTFIEGDETQITEDMEVLAEAVRRGIILSPEVTSLKGRKNFAFTPQVGLPIHEKIILEKAMAILSCVRYGEHFGSITKVRFPDAILNRLLSSPHRIGEHTEIKTQYSILVSRGMGNIFPHRQWKNRYFFKLVPTEENLRAVRLARDLLSVGEAIHEKGLSEELRKVLFYQGKYEEAARTLPKLKKSIKYSPQTREAVFDIFNDTLDQLRGATS